VDKKYKTKNSLETQDLGKNFAKEALLQPLKNTAVVLALHGNLGGGKTTFLQGLANGLGIKDKILSPTFVIMKRFKIPKSKFKNFYHIDLYRIENGKDAGSLEINEIIKNPENIVAIEWPEKIKKILPPKTIKISFKFIDDNNREIIFKSVL